MDVYKDKQQIHLKNSESSDIELTTTNTGCQNISYKNFVEISDKIISGKLRNIDKHLTNLSERIKIIERTITLNEIAVKLKKHYEQTGRNK